MDNNRFETEQGAYHFALMDILDFISRYGYGVVLQDINDYHTLEILKQVKQDPSLYTEFGGIYDEE